MTLLTGTLLTVLGLAPEGNSNPIRANVITSTGVLQAFVKPGTDTERVLAEVIASLVGIKLGLPVGEPIVVKVSDASLGLAQGYHFGSVALPHPDLRQHVRDRGAKAQRELKKWREVVRAACFDEWIANNDRHNGNIISDGRGNYWLIDHDRALMGTVAANDPIPLNQLFDLLLKGAADPVVEKLRPRTEAAMTVYESASFTDVLTECAPIFDPTSIQRFERLLTSRQPELTRLGRGRFSGVSSKQGSIFG